MPRTSNTLTRRRQIVQGLMTTMAEVGYDGATIPLIARAAGLTPGLIHYHFDSKQSILIDLIDHLKETILTRFRKLAKRSDGQSQLTAFIEAHVGLGEGADANAVACWISIGAEAVRQPEVRAEYRRVTRIELKMLESIVAQTLAEAKRSAKKKREIALVIMSAIEGAYRLLISAPELIVPGFAAPTIKAMALGLIERQPKV